MESVFKEVSALVDQDTRRLTYAGFKSFRTVHLNPFRLHGFILAYVGTDFTNNSLCIYSAYLP